MRQLKKENDVDRRQNIIDLFIGAKIRLRRLALGMSESDLASAGGIAVDRVLAMEAGEERLGAPQLLQFSQLLDAPISWFFEGIKDDAILEYGGRLPDRMAESRAKEVLEELTHSFGNLTDSDHKALVLLIVNWLANLEMRKIVDNSIKH